MSLPLCRECSRPEADMPSRGPYTKLCKECRQARASRIAKGREESKVVQPGKLENAVKAMLPVCRRLEHAANGYAAARMERQLAASEFNTAIRALSEAAQKVMNADRVAKARIDEGLERERAVGGDA